MRYHFTSVRMATIKEIRITDAAKDTEKRKPCTLVFGCFCLFRAIPTAYGGSQARRQIGAVVAGLHHSHGNAGSQLCL